MDQKLKTIDEMGKLADQYVALRKQVKAHQFRLAKHIKLYLTTEM